jgi:predicted component of type VI protein secretion system
MGGSSMVSQNTGAKAKQMAKRNFLAIAVIGLLTLGGCSPSSEPSAATQAALAKTELHFDINACQQIEPGLYKCPAADEPICNPDYNGQAECVRIGPEGSVFVQSGFAD